MCSSWAGSVWTVLLDQDYFNQLCQTDTLALDSPGWWEKSKSCDSHWPIKPHCVLCRCLLSLCQKIGCYVNCHRANWQTVAYTTSSNLQGLRGLVSVCPNSASLVLLSCPRVCAVMVPCVSDSVKSQISIISLYLQPITNICLSNMYIRSTCSQSSRNSRREGRKTK